MRLTQPRAGCSSWQSCEREYLLSRRRSPGTGCIRGRFSASSFWYATFASFTPTGLPPVTRLSVTTLPSVAPLPPFSSQLSTAYCLIFPFNPYNPQTLQTFFSLFFDFFCPDFTIELHFWYNQDSYRMQIRFRGYKTVIFDFNILH